MTSETIAIYQEQILGLTLVGRSTRGKVSAAVGVFGGAVTENEKAAAHYCNRSMRLAPHKGSYSLTPVRHDASKVKFSSIYLIVVILGLLLKNKL
jgi:hypothetical protein